MQEILSKSDLSKNTIFAFLVQIFYIDKIKSVSNFFQCENNKGTFLDILEHNFQFEYWNLINICWM